jgi:hypothetical protein
MWREVRLWTEAGWAIGGGNADPPAPAQARRSAAPQDCQAGKLSPPCVFGLYSVVPVLAQARHPDGKVPVRKTAWYHTSQPTFAAVWAAVRLHCWRALSYPTAAPDSDLVDIPRSDRDRLAQAVCDAH